MLSSLCCLILLCKRSASKKTRALFKWRSDLPAFPAGSAHAGRPLHHPSQRNQAPFHGRLHARVRILDDEARRRRQRKPLRRQHEHLRIRLGARDGVAVNDGVKKAVQPIFSRINGALRLEEPTASSTERPRSVRTFPALRPQGRHGSSRRAACGMSRSFPPQALLFLARCMPQGSFPG